LSSNRKNSRLTAGLLAAGIIGISLVIGLIVVLGDWTVEAVDPGTMVEPDQISGTILFGEADNQGNQTISRIEADGTELQSLVTRPVLRPDTPGFNWAPDGESFAWFDTDDINESASLVVTSADGSESTTIDTPPISGVNRIDAQIDWSQDGRYLAFMHQDPGDDQLQIGIADLQSDEIDLIDSPEDGNLGHPVWHPEEPVLAFTETAPDGIHRIVLLDMDSDEQTVLVEDEEIATQPTWAPNGAAIVYVGSGGDEGRRTLHLVNLQSTRVSIVNEYDRTDYLPDWSPRGQLALMSDEADGNYELLVVDPDGSELTILTEDYDWRIFHPKWNDSGRYLTFTSQSPDEDQWRINVYDIDEHSLWTVYESDDPLYFADWRPATDVD
jgi:Tol biopolymer transport system component